MIFFFNYCELTSYKNYIPQDELDRLTVKLNNINEDTEMMKRGLDDMDSSSVMIDRANQTTQQELDQLQ